MKETVKWLESEELDFYIHIWEEETVKTKGVFYLVHGSVEHSYRYQHFAEKLTKEGYIVVAPDLRGHGKTGEKAKSLGYFSDNPMGWELCVHDLKYIYDAIVAWYPELPIVIFGHSMGSYLVRCFLKEYPVAISGAILSGTGGFAKGIGDFGIWIAKLMMHIKGRRHKSSFLTNLVYGTLNSKITQIKTPFDFLSRDEEVVSKYIEDPLCGYVCTAEFIHEMVLGTRKSNQREMFQLRNSQLPMLIVSGEEDPVGDKNNKGILGVVASYKKYMSSVTFKLYPNARHEVLNELDRERIMEDMIRWLSTLN